MYPMGCFNINQVLLWEKDFDRNNLTRWCRKGLLVKLRNQHYAFPEYRQVPDFSRYVANRMYTPSYISLHSALSFYGIIPEEVVQLTSVTTLKTAKFENSFGTFHYQNVKTPLFFRIRNQNDAKRSGTDVRHTRKSVTRFIVSESVLQDGTGYGRATPG